VSGNHRAACGGWPDLPDCLHDGAIRFREVATTRSTERLVYTNGTIEKFVSASATHRRPSFGQARMAKQHMFYEDDEQREPILKSSGIVIIHRCTFYRDCLVRCLELHYDAQAIAAYDSVQAWIDTKGTSPPPEAIILFRSARVESDEDLRDLATVMMQVPVIVLSDNEETDRISNALRNGVRGYIPTSLPFNLALQAVRYVVAGGTFVPAQRTQHNNESAHPSNNTPAFTDRQTMVIAALCRGMANKQIAFHLGMSEHTVKIHIRHIMRRLNVRNRTEVAMLGRRFLEMNSGRIASD
jgi:DNA-binding NarL/FixJ family response regulator